MKGFFKFFLIISVFTLQSCGENALIDTFENIPETIWSYDKNIKEKVEIKDIDQSYNVYINFRHTNEYKYANIWLRISVIDPSGKKTIERKEFQLALQDGEWLGKGSGNMYSYRLIFKENFKFNKAGNYSFVIEQNMRDNPLTAISDIGLRIEPSK